VLIVAWTFPSFESARSQSSGLGTSQIHQTYTSKKGACPNEIKRFEGLYFVKTLYRTAPTPSAQIPSGIPFIIGNELAERFSYYGMRAILVVFMTQYFMDAGGNFAPMPL